MKKLRLLLTEDCDRRCTGCCNKDFDLSALPVCTDFTPYDMIMLTGGEPMLYPDLIRKAVIEIRKQTKAPIILYTAKCDNIVELEDIVKHYADGITFTLHKTKDIVEFVRFVYLTVGQLRDKSLRLNIFKEVNWKNEGWILTERALFGWKIKDNIEWIEDCPLPDGEVFMRYE